jgi:aminoglycoside phosphotransferase (APT) family kinase protein
VFVDGDEVTGVIDWSEAAQGDALFDLAILTLGHEEHLDDVVAGYGTDVDLDVIRGWWSWRSLSPLAGRARLRPVLAGLRVRRAEVPDVRLAPGVNPLRRPWCASPDHDPTGPETSVRQ